MNTENKVSFATIVATGERPDGAIHAAHIGQGVTTEFNATGEDIVILVAALVRGALELCRREGGRMAVDILAAIAIHELGSAVNLPAARAALARAGRAESAQEADENGEL